MTKARELAELIGVSGTSEQVLAGRKNLIINGAMQVWQRGTSLGSLVGYSADRWKISTGGTGSVSRQDFTVGQTDVPGEPQHYLRISKSDTADYVHFYQPVEGVRNLAGQTATLSFYAKANAAVAMTGAYVQYFGSSGSTPAVTTNWASTVSVTTSWQKFEVTVTLPSISGKTIGGGNDYLRVDLYPGNKASSWTGTFDLAQVQLEVGSVATPFEHRSYGEELALCQRYYQKNERLTVTTGYQNGTGQILIFCPLCTPLRAIPSTSYSLSTLNVSTASSPDFTNYTISSTAASNLYNNNITQEIYFNLSGWSGNDNDACFVWANGLIELDSEL